MLRSWYGKGIHVLKAGSTELSWSLRTWIFGVWPCEPAGHYQTIRAQFRKTGTDASTDIRRAPPRTACAASCSRSPENCRQDPDHRRRDSYRQRHWRAHRFVRSASPGHQAHHRKHYYPESRRSTGAASRTIQFRRVVSADRIYGPGAKLLERLFSARHQLIDNPATREIPAIGVAGRLQTGALSNPDRHK